jgi:hypothetical protein
MAGTVECEVEGESEFGEYANSFRVVHEGDELLLDFCLYQDGRAKLVRRLRVTRGLFGAIVERMVEERRADLMMEDGRLVHDGVVAEG